MKRILIMAVIAQMLLAMTGCASAFKTASVGDDLYEIHNKTDIAKRQKAEAELAKAQAEARKAQWEAKIAEAEAAAAANGSSGTVTYGTTTSVNPYDAVLADDYESAYARRLYGFSSPTYRMPSSYYSLRYSDAFSYATAYDPAFYNVMVSGDQVWVEPKYITSMFGTWGASVAFPSYSWYYGWSATPSFYAWWGYPRYSWYDWHWGYDPYWGCGWAWGYPYHHHHYHPYPTRPPHHGGDWGGRPRYGDVVHRPHNGGSSYRGNPSYSGGTRGNYGSGYNGTVRRGGGTTSGSGIYRGNQNGSYRNNGSSSGSGQYRGNGNSGQYRGNSNGTRNNGSSWNSRSESNSWNSNSGSSYNRGSSSGYSGGYSGGGNYSGGSHGGGQRRR